MTKTQQAAATVSRDNFNFFWPLRVRYAEIDAQNVVFNAHYLTYFDVALTEACRVEGHDWIADARQTGCDFQLVKSLVEYKKPLRFDDNFDIAARVKRLGNSSVQWQLAIFRGSALHATGEIIWVYSHIESASAVTIPQAFRQLVQRRELLSAPSA